MQANQSNVVWTVIIVGVVLLLAMFFMIQSAKNDTTEKVAQLENQIDTNLDAAVNQLNTVAQGLKNTPTTSKLDTEICDNTDGCNGWRLKTSYRNDAVNAVRDELEEDGNRDFYDFLSLLYDIDNEEDIEDVSLHRIGRVRASEELDSNFDFSDTMEIYVEYAVEVEYHPDGDSDTKTKYVKVTATLYNLEDGIHDADIKDIKVVDIDKDDALSSN